MEAGGGGYQETPGSTHCSGWGRVRGYAREDAAKLGLVVGGVLCEQERRNRVVRLRAGVGGVRDKGSCAGVGGFRGAQAVSCPKKTPRFERSCPLTGVFAH